MSLKSLVAVGTLLCVLPAVAKAQTPASGIVNVKATVAAICSLQPMMSTTRSLDFSKPSSLSPTGVIDTVKKTATFSNATCNVPTHVSMFTFNGGATNGNYIADAGHQDFFDYLAVATFENATVSLNTTGLTKGVQTATATSAGTSSGPFTGNLTVDVTPSVPALGLVAGTYADSIRVTLTAN